MDTVWRDIRFALRLLGATPGVAAFAILSLGLAIAANTTIFSVIYTVLLAPPIYKDVDRLVVIWETNKPKGVDKTGVAPPTFRDWRENARAFEQLELVAPGSPVTVTGSGLPERANIQYATPDLFKMLGVQPIAGRFFSDEELKNTDPILLSYGYWQHRFGGNPASIHGHTVVNGTVRTIVSVLPKDFHLFETDTDIWMPIAAPDASAQNRSFRVWLIAVGKLKPNVKLKSAQAEMEVLARPIDRAHPDSNKDWGVKIEPIQEAQFGEWKPILYPLLGMVIFVLLISCANIANLLLGRLASRRREISIRASLGASRARLMVQLLNEGVLIGLLGCGAGLVLTGWGIHLFVARAPDYFPLLHSIKMNVPVLLFCVAISLTSGSALAIIPAIAGTRADLHNSLNKLARGVVGRGNSRFRAVFVVTQIALSLMLLLATGLMIRSFVRVLAVNPGFRADHVVTMQIFLTGPRYLHGNGDRIYIHDEIANFYQRLLEGTSTLPGVQSVGLVSWLPERYGTGRRERTFSIEGRTGSASERSTADFNAVSADYFKTLQIPLVKGRNFNAMDIEGAPWTAIVNQAFVQRYWPGEDPIGKRLLTDGGIGEKPREIIGVVADVHQDALEKKTQPEIFAPFPQQSRIAFGHGYQNRVHMNLVIRGIGNPDAMVAGARKIAAKMDSNQPIYGVETMPDVLSDATALRRLHTTLLEIFASIALFLSAIGVYSVISHSVSERTTEIGLRMAVGATAADVRRLVFGQGFRLIFLGMIIGLAGALVFNRLLASFLFGVTAHDPATLVAVCGLLTIVAIGAAWIPVRRAVRVDPVIALRHE